LTLILFVRGFAWGKIYTMPPERKIIRLAPNRYLGRGTYFVTCCTDGRRPIFRDSARASWIIQTLKTVSESTGFKVHAYCVMPDHLHVVVEGCSDDCDLGRFVKALKQLTAFHSKKESGETLWQRRFYDHILRPSDSLDAVAWYVWLNPVRAGLCTDAKTYPHSGSFTSDWGGKVQSKEDWVPPWKSETP
jgi:putative transposase